MASYRPGTGGTCSTHPSQSWEIQHAIRCPGAHASAVSTPARARNGQQEGDTPSRPGCRRPRWIRRWREHPSNIAVPTPDQGRGGQSGAPGRQVQRGPAGDHPEPDSGREAAGPNVPLRPGELGRGATAWARAAWDQPLVGHAPAGPPSPAPFPTQVFPGDTSQERLYESTVAPLVEEMLEGFNCTIFAYGTSQLLRTAASLPSAS